MSLTQIGAWAIAIPVGMLLYAYVGYPLLLWVLAIGRRETRHEDPEDWPSVSVSLIAHNEEESIGGTLDALLQSDYPPDKLQILVTSDASTDRTDEIVREYESRGVELLRAESRGGKTAAENEATKLLRGEVVVNTDATIRLRPSCIKGLVVPFADPTVGVTSGRDISVGGEGTAALAGETGYVGYEMWVRSLESRLGSIIGASGCCYAMRADLHRMHVPEILSRDFAAPLKAREQGYRSVHVGDAVCLVPRSVSVGIEYERKARTIVRGLLTLSYYRVVLNPFRYGGFALKLISHKLCRWLAPLLFPLAGAGIALLAVEHPWARVALGLCLAGLAVAWAVVRWPDERGTLPNAMTLLGFAVSSNIAVIAAWARFFTGARSMPAFWEPTRREPIDV